MTPCGVFGCRCPDFLPDGLEDDDPCRCAHPQDDHFPTDPEGAT